MAQSQAERLSSKIEEDILSFKFKPGERLDENRLAEKYGTSRTPVREALRQLSSNGLVEVRPHKGAIVAKVGIKELVELFEVLAELEGACGRLAAKSSLKKDIQAICDAQAQCRHNAELGDAFGYERANDVFHEAIYRAGHNECLQKLTIGIRNRVAPYRRWLLHARNRLGEAIDEHEHILRAIESGLADETDRLLQVHILNRGAEVRRLIAVLPQWVEAAASGKSHQVA